MARNAKLLTELVGTFLFLTAIALSANAGSLAPLAIGGALMAMVFMGGHISGAHYNPAVSLAAFLRRKIDATDLVSYWLAQLAGATLGFVFGYLVGGHAGGIHPGRGAYGASALAVEVVFSAALALVVLNVAATRATAGNSFYGLAIGFTIVIAAFVGGPISGGAFNPAVGFGATLTAAIFNSGAWGDLWLYIVGPMVGAAIAAGIHYLQLGSEAPQE
jgi:aquaporin Z